MGKHGAKPTGRGSRGATDSTRGEVRVSADPPAATPPADRPVEGIAAGIEGEAALAGRASPQPTNASSASPTEEPAGSTQRPLPAVAPRHRLPARRKRQPRAVARKEKKARDTGLASPLDQYLREVSRYPVLSREEEAELARRWRDHGDVEAARKLVTANLRFVVKIAYEYRRYNVRLIDLIQEGNIGLMKAVRKFNPDRGYRLISYAVWWIRAYMQNYIIRNWSMVKVGTTTRQRRMLFGSREAREEARREEQEEVFLIPAESIGPGRAADLARGSAETARRDFSLDVALDEDGRMRWGDLVADPAKNPEEALAEEETRQLVRDRLEAIVDTLNERERFILENRLIADEPMTLQQIGNHFGVTRERARQLEANLRRKLLRSFTRTGHPVAELAPASA